MDCDDCKQPLDPIAGHWISAGKVFHLACGSVTSEMLITDLRCDLAEAHSRYEVLRDAAGRLLTACATGNSDPEAERIVYEHTRGAK